MHIVYGAVALHGGRWHRDGGYVVVDGAQSLRVVLEASRGEEGRCDRWGHNINLPGGAPRTCPGRPLFASIWEVFSTVVFLTGQ